jgi:hypothetical protein
MSLKAAGAALIFISYFVEEHEMMKRECCISASCRTSIIQLKGYWQGLDYKMFTRKHHYTFQLHWHTHLTYTQQNRRNYINKYI